MNKKLFYAIGLVILIVGVVYAATHLPNGLIIGTDAQELNANVTVEAGGIYVAGTLEVDGAIRLDGAVTANGTFTASAGLINISESFNDVVAASTVAIRSSRATVNVTTQTLVAGGTMWTTVNFSTQPDCARVVSLIVFSSVTAGGAAGWTSSATWTVNGITSRGNTLTETITSTANALVFTSNAWMKVSTVTVQISTFSRVGTLLFNIDTATMSNVHIFVGIGNTVGLANDIIASTDVYKIKEATGHVETDNAGVIITPGYDTINFATEPDGIMDYSVWYKPRSK